MKGVIESTLHRVYLLTLRSCDIYLKGNLYFKKKISPKKEQKILVLPYHAEDWPGGVERFSNWKPYFEKNGIIYKIHWSHSKSEYLHFVSEKRVWRKYKFHFSILFRRVNILRSLYLYSAIYIQRSCIPLYDSRSISIDKTVLNEHWNVTYDFYDADYLSTPRLTEFIFNSAQKITVASLFLRDKLLPYKVSVLFSRLCLKSVPKYQKPRTNELIIGWMGSPGNSKNLLYLDNVFKELETEFPNVIFSFGCRTPLNFTFTKFEQFDIDAPNFNYEEWLKKVDIGIVPYFEDSERTLAKTAMKSLEFWNHGIALVCSPWGMSDAIRDEFNCLIATSKNNWKNQIKRLVLSVDLREQIGSKGKQTFEEFHTYENNFAELRNFILEPQE